MKNENKDEIENPAELSAEDLLRFLEAVPQILREREARSEMFSVSALRSATFRDLAATSRPPTTASILAAKAI